MSTHPNSPRKVAIFDIDGTIFRSSLLIELVEVLIEKGLFPESARTEYNQEKTLWLDRKGHYDFYIMAVVHSFMKNIKGLRHDDFMEAASIVIKRYRFRTYRFTEELILQLKKDGYYLLAISHSPKSILDLFCKELGFDKVYGKIYNVNEEGVFTGEIKEHEFISNKESVLRHALEKESLTLEGSVGVGDSESDIKFLNIVERPICFNPDMKLWNHAKEKGWEVIVERKNVIYELNKIG
jgi:HAD superfamily hydrolase (TIGR01490 family)